LCLILRVLSVHKDRIKRENAESIFQVISVVPSIHKRLLNLTQVWVLLIGSHILEPNVVEVTVEQLFLISSGSLIMIEDIIVTNR
jgi:hypothetical protein